MALAEWSRDQQKRGNTYAVEAARRLQREFGDISTPSSEVLGIWNTAVLLRELQRLPARSIPAERKVVETTFRPGLASLVNERVAYASTYLISANKWVREVNEQPDQPSAIVDDYISKDVRFGGFRLGRTDSIDRWHLMVKDIQTEQSYGIPVENLGGIVEKFEPLADPDK